MINFIIHLRLHYQFFILSGGYLLGGLLVIEPVWTEYWLQFINVHVLLFGGATAFNSYWDKDEGPIGGLKNPPKMKPWMRNASLILQLAGFLWSITLGLLYSLIYAVSILLFWLYSTPLARWKGKPVLSLIAIGFSTGTNSTILGALAAGMDFSWIMVTAGLGTALVMLSLYPVSQIYQLNEDKERGDTTFAIYYGLKGIRRFFSISFITGIAAVTISIFYVNRLIAIAFGGLGLLVWIVLLFWVNSLQGDKEEYNQVMRIKFTASASFVTFLVTAILLKHL